MSLLTSVQAKTSHMFMDLNNVEAVSSLDIFTVWATRLVSGILGSVVRPSVCHMKLLLFLIDYRCHTAAFELSIHDGGTRSARGLRPTQVLQGANSKPLPTTIWRLSTDLVGLPSTCSQLIPTWRQCSKLSVKFKHVLEPCRLQLCVQYSSTATIRLSSVPWTAVWHALQPAARPFLIFSFWTASFLSICSNAILSVPHSIFSILQIIISSCIDFSSTILAT